MLQSTSDRSEMTPQAPGTARRLPHSDSDFATVLRGVLAGSEDVAGAHQLLSMSAEPLHACTLFEAAGRLRDQHVGRRFQASGVISPVAACDVTPSCAYCPLDNTRLISMEQALATLPILAAAGLRHVYLNGGTRLAGYDSEALVLVEAAVADGMAPVLNFGPSFSVAGLRALHKAGLAALVASTEVFSPELFARLKPGEDFSARLALLNACEDEGIPFETTTIVGAGENPEDHLRHLYRLRAYRQIRRVSFSRFRPAASTPMADRARCSPWTVARLVALARLILPDCEIALNMGTEADELPLWFAAGGGGGRIHAVTVSPRDVDHLPAGEGCRLERNIVDRRSLMKSALHEIGAFLDDSNARKPT